jgi:murein DD-endopeptidase MepM/ murein hydrolase activator NlpD
LLSFCALGLPLGAGLAMGYVIGHQPPNAVEDELGAALRERMRIVDPVRSETPQLGSFTERAPALDAYLITSRESVTHAINDLHIHAAIKEAKALPLGIGGPSVGEAVAPGSQDIYRAIERLSRRIDDREQQLDSLVEWLAHRQVGERALWAAEPVQRAGISSYFGMRIDPFSGRRAMHEGIDFSAKPGTAIMAAGDGVVTFAGEKQSYGRLIEIDHGDDCFTRYAHSKLIVVKAGDLVKKGQVIALMGSSGRSTGSHLHFEVYKHGRAVDPFVYIHQASR